MIYEASALPLSLALHKAAAWLLKDIDKQLFKRKK